jgi:hypothetical protein
MVAVGGVRPYSPGAPGGMAAGALAPSAPFTPQDYDSSLVHISRGEALHLITYASVHPDGGLLAWSATVSFAEALMPMASTDDQSTFLKAYADIIMSAARTRRYPTRALWRICSLEMKRQGRLGDDKSLPMDKEAFGLESTQ